eukprot:SAG31_NODE_851_length_11519_cov_4.727145_9_plen_162_part_00
MWFSLVSFLDDEADAFDALHSDCAGKGERATLYIVDSLDCDATAYLPISSGRGAAEPLATIDNTDESSCADQCDDTDSCAVFGMAPDGSCQLLQALGASSPPDEWHMFEMASVVSGGPEGCARSGQLFSVLLRAYLCDCASEQYHGMRAQTLQARRSFDEL